MRRRADASGWDKRYFARANVPPPLRKKIDFDWDDILERVNAVYDQVDAGLRATGYTSQRKALAVVEGRVRAMGRQARQWQKAGGYAGDLRRVLAKGQVDVAQVRRDLTDAIANEVIAVTFASYDPIPASRAKAIAWERLAGVALAVTAYRLDRRELPAGLADLVPKYLNAVPLDPFTGEGVVVSSPGVSLEDAGGVVPDDITWSWQ